MLNDNLGMFNNIENIIGAKINSKLSYESLINQCIKYFDLLLGSILIVTIGYFIAKILKKIIKKFGNNTNINSLFINFASKFVFSITIIVFFISALNNLGIQTTSIATVIGALSVGIGLAFQNSLSNFAAGLLIVLLRPFKLNDLIEIGNITGTVTSIDTLMIKIKTRDNKIVTIPNSKLTSDIIINHTAENKRRIKFFIKVNDTLNVIQAIEILKELATQEKLFIKGQEIYIYLESIDKDKEGGICIEVWAKTHDLAEINATFKQKIINQFNYNKIKISFPISNIQL